MTAKVSAIEVANRFLSQAHEHGDQLSNLKLQKLLYYAHAWYLVLNEDQPLFDDRIEAWVHGPVVPNVYHEFKQYGWQPIMVEPDKNPLPKDISTHLKDIWEVFSSYSAFDLERMTHQEAPWINARGDLEIDEPSSNAISNSDMATYYRQLCSQEN